MGMSHARAGTARSKTLAAIAAAGLMLSFCASVMAQQPNIGIAPVTLTESSYTFDTAEQHRIRVVVVAKGLKHPFSAAVLPSGDALVSERGGPLRIVRNAVGAGGKPSTLEAEPVGGLPVVAQTYRNAGLHDLALHPQFAENQLVYFTFNKAGNPPPPDAKPPIRRESIVTLMRGKLVGNKLVNVEELFTGESGSTSGSRIAFGKDGTLYMTTGGPF